MDRPPTPPQLSVLESAVVAPPPAPETFLPLTFSDVYWLNSPPVERVFFYRLTPGTGNDAVPSAILSTLRCSLSQALRAYFPLAGRLRLTLGTADRYELHYRPGDGFAFTVAECAVDVDEMAADGPREVARILPLVPPLSAGVGPVLSLQATVLRGGIAVGISLYHAACISLHHASVAMPVSAKILATVKPKHGPKLKGGLRINSAKLQGGICKKDMS